LVHHRADVHLNFFCAIKKILLRRLSDWRGSDQGGISTDFTLSFAPF